MQDHSPHLSIIGQLAREYDQKYKELESLISELAPDQVPPYMRALAERSTDRFRSAQISLIATPGLFDSKENESAIIALTAMSRAFDELRILFHTLLQISSDNAAGN